jgi:hypothetical protein
MIRRPRGALYVSATLLLAFETVACGNAGNSNSNRLLESIAVTPPTADAQNFANGQVQFTATGTFSRPPSPAPVPSAEPYGGGWYIYNSKGATQSIATISQTGLAQCKLGASGAVEVQAMASTGECGGEACTYPVVQGSATLTCP